MEAMLDQIQDTLDMEAILKGLIIQINIQREWEGHLGYVYHIFDSLHQKVLEFLIIIVSR